jgi:putative resolvase
MICGLSAGRKPEPIPWYACRMATVPRVQLALQPALLATCDCLQFFTIFSSRDQKSDLVRQQELLEAFCAAKGWRHEVIADLGSGLNYRKKGLNRLLELVLHKRIRRLVLTHKDRLLRFGSELIFALCEIQNIEIVIINKGEPPSFEEELAQDVIEIITVFSARLYGSRSHKTKRLLNDLKDGEVSTAEPEIITKSMKPQDVPDEAVRGLLASMQDVQFRAMSLYAKFLMKRDEDVARS